MIKVTIELLPHGREKNKREIGRAFICNNGTGDYYSGNYVIRFEKEIPKKLWKKAQVLNFPRLSESAWNLLWRALNEIFVRKGK